MGWKLETFKYAIEKVFFLLLNVVLQRRYIISRRITTFYILRLVVWLKESGFKWLSCPIHNTVLKSFVCSKSLLHIKSSKCIFPDTTCPLSKSTRTRSTRLQYPELSTPLPLGAILVAIKQAIYWALNATKRSYQTCY